MRRPPANPTRPPASPPPPPFAASVKSNSFVCPPAPFDGAIACAQTFKNFMVNPNEVIRVELWADTAKDVFLGAVERPWSDFVAKDKMHIEVFGGKGPAASTSASARRLLRFPSRAPHSPPCPPSPPPSPVTGTVEAWSVFDARTQKTMTKTNPNSNPLHPNQTAKWR